MTNGRRRYGRLEDDRPQVLRRGVGDDDQRLRVAISRISHPPPVNIMATPASLLSVAGTRTTRKR